MSFREGDKVYCWKCGRQVTVKLASKDGKVSIGTPEGIRNMAFKCQDCGYIVCGSCMMPVTYPAIPTCPSCKSEGGPYPFKES